MRRFNIDAKQIQQLLSYQLHHGVTRTRPCWSAMFGGRGSDTVDLRSKLNAEIVFEK